MDAESETHLSCSQQFKRLAFVSPTIQTVVVFEGRKEFVRLVGKCYPHSPLRLMESLPAPPITEGSPAGQIQMH